MIRENTFTEIGTDPRSGSQRILGTIIIFKMENIQNLAFLLNQYAESPDRVRALANDLERTTASLKQIFRPAPTNMPISREFTRN